MRRSFKGPSDWKLRHAKIQKDTSEKLGPAEGLSDSKLPDIAWDRSVFGSLGISVAQLTAPVPVSVWDVRPTVCGSLYDASIHTPTSVILQLLQDVNGSQ